MYNTFNYGNTNISYTLIRKKRKTLGITVKPDKSIVVSSPEGKEIKEIENILIKKGKWILKQINYFDSLPSKPLEKEYVPGESFKILGRQYRLKVYASESKSVKLTTNGIIHVTLKNPKDKDGKYQSKEIKKILDTWYRQKAKEYLLARSIRIFKKLEYLNLPTPEIKIKKMRKRWGSCSSKYKILLNSELIKAPCDCIDYVIIHEHLHLKIHNHSKKFYALLFTVLPRWERLKDKLDKLDG